MSRVRICAYGCFAREHDRFYFVWTAWDGVVDPTGFGYLVVPGGAWYACTPNKDEFVSVFTVLALITMPVS